MPNLPMMFTLLRVILLLPIAIFLYIGLDAAALAVFIVAAISDALDGYTARKLSLVSSLGAVADQVSDKAFVIGMLVLLAWAGRLDGAWVLIALGLIAREFSVIALREWSAGEGKAIPVAPMGKIKTAVQMVALGLIVAFPNFLIAGHLTLLVALCLSIASAAVYVKVRA